MLPIKKLPNSEKPYEKLEMFGEKTLSNSELLAIILKTGTKEQTAVGLAQTVLSLRKNTDLRALQQIPLKELKQIKGIGRVKAIQIRAICEIAKRMAMPLNLNIVIKSPQDVANIITEEVRYEKREIVKLLILNNKNVVEKIVDLSKGNNNQATVEIKQILEEVLKTGMSKFILVHNHPSGDSKPSSKDIEITKKIEIAANLLELQLLDHIIIGDGNFYSIYTKIAEDKDNKNNKIPQNNLGTFG